MSVFTNRVQRGGLQKIDYHLVANQWAVYNNPTELYALRGIRWILSWHKLYHHLSPLREKWWSVPYETYVLFFLQSGPKVNSASWQMVAAHEDFDATRGISSHCICTRHIHSLWTRPNLEAVLLVAMVATVDNTATSLALSLWSRVANRRSMT